MSTYLEFLHDHWVGDAAGSSKPAKEVNVPKFPSIDEEDRQVHFGGNEYGPSPFTTERDKKKKDGNPLQPNMVPYVKGDPMVHPHNFSNPYGDEKGGDKTISEKEFRKRVNAFAR